MNQAGRRRVAIQGERGSFSEEAAIRLLGEEIEIVPRATFEGMFSAVGERAADCALAPIENSLAGSVHRSFDLLEEHALSIVGEVIIPIAHNLIGAPGATLQQIRVVESHPVALAQCERFFIEHPGLKRIATEDTAGSVRRVVEAGDASRAAIASRRAAELYGGAILQEHLEDSSENYTRFLLLSASCEPARAADKLSIVFQTAHLPGALHRALEPFARRDINMLKIESRPVHGRPWEYRFYLDLEISASDPVAVAALEELRRHSVNLRILGSYPSAEILRARKSCGL
ncbi:MAG TPA: prephenate dehydratase [Candidatus Sulfotelmatobacter sp.]|nr:prephenate dehydratase [Candidatus Sulfotelmatobacter sp.]